MEWAFILSLLGVFLSVAVMGPRTNFFVDKASCQVVSP